MTERLKVLQALADRYERTQAGRTGQARRDFSIDYEELLRMAGCIRGEDRICAERDLKEAESKNLLRVERHHRAGIPLTIRFSSENETPLFRVLGRIPPTERRNKLAEFFRSAAALEVPEEFRLGWEAFCHTFSDVACSGGSLSPFSREDLRSNTELMTLLPKLLAWRGESLMRFASSILCRDSKRLEYLKSRIEFCLEKITSGKVTCLSDLGILENERSLLINGPLQLVFDHCSIDLSLLTAPVRIDRRDIVRADLVPGTSRCLTIENASMFHELSKLRAGVILASSGSEGGFAHSAIVTFLQKLPPQIECWHFGDSDPKGFEILHNLRERVRTSIHSLHMNFRPDPQSPPLNRAEIDTIGRLLLSPFISEPEKEQLRLMRNFGRKGLFEQESLGLPRSSWPFYDAL
jgi:hypothetical protein